MSCVYSASVRIKRGTFCRFFLLSAARDTVFTLNKWQLDRDFTHHFSRPVRCSAGFPLLWFTVVRSVCISDRSPELAAWHLGHICESRPCLSHGPVGCCGQPFRHRVLPGAVARAPVLAPRPLPVHPSGRAGVSLWEPPAASGVVHQCVSYQAAGGCTFISAAHHVFCYDRTCDERRDDTDQRCR